MRNGREGRKGKGRKRILVDVDLRAYVEGVWRVRSDVMRQVLRWRGSRRKGRNKGVRTCNRGSRATSVCVGRAGWLRRPYMSSRRAESERHGLRRGVVRGVRCLRC